MKDTESVAYNQLFKQLQLLRIAIVSGVILFAGVVGFLIASHTVPPDKSLQTTFNIIIPAFVLSMIGVSMVIYKALLQKAKAQPDLDEKLKAYRSANIIRMALLDGPALLAIVIGLLIGQVLYLIVPAMMIVMIMIHRISPESAAQELDLQYPEREQLVSDTQAW